MSQFKIRVYVNGSSPLVLGGGTDAFGIYIETREASGAGHTAIPSKRVTIQKGDLRELPDGSDADFELIHPLPAEAF